MIELKGLAAPGEGDDAPPEGQKPAALAPFSPRRLRRQLWVDTALRWALALAMVALLGAALVLAGDQPLAVAGALALALGGWMIVNGLSARTTALLPRVTGLIERDPEGAEHHLAWHLRRRPLMRWVRLMVYHRLAVLRHHQRRYAQSALIGETILSYRLGPAEGSRRQLLLLVAEARLALGDLTGAYPAIAALHQASLGLAESLQRLALQTRYELLAGYPDRALWQHALKVQQAELMPAQHDGALHAALATAADRCGEAELGRWLWDRVALLCEPDQRRRLTEAGFIEPVVQPPSETDAGAVKA
jgi:hypothetical protein